ncbi:cupin [Pseudomonas brassicacearum]|uniref:Cupin n=1 Tax=Pseudomonas brassicacearum TaxID=930166 RepID=A0A423HCB9_9PSED|nr:cupin domain-containing protein [Pseudomonas brassicacearum]RON10822.1 cupin [Pseudomonas brassicacearum]
MPIHPLKTSFVILACLVIAGCSTTSTKPAIEKEILLQSSSSWDGSPYTAYPSGSPELTLLKLKIPANTELEWHTHPIPNAAYILAGELTVEAKASGQTQLLKQGQTLAEMVGIVHRGKTGDRPVELIVFYAGSQGVPLSEKP